MTKFKRLLAAMLATTIMFSGGANVSASSGLMTPDRSYNTPVSKSEPKKSAGTATTPSTYSQKAKKLSASNQYVVGWLHVPNTNVNTPIVQRADKYNDYYLNNDINGNPNKNGTFCADRRSTLGSGSSDQIGWNTILYGHSWDDNMNGQLFSQIKRYRNTEFARENPYIYFSSTEENMVWEIFAVFDADINLPYNRPDMTEETMDKLLKIVKETSIYSYDVNVSSKDKFLTLSTCTYSVPGYEKLSSPNDFRYVIMAKLVPAGQATKTTASFEINSSPRSPNFSHLAAN